MTKHRVGVRKLNVGLPLVARKNGVGVQSILG